MLLLQARAKSEEEDFLFLEKKIGDVKKCSILLEF